MFKNSLVLEIKHFGGSQGLLENLPFQSASAVLCYITFPLS